MKQKFFMYGTLKKGGRLAGQFDHLRTSAVSAKLEGFNLFRLGWYPSIKAGPGKVCGEVHEFSKDVLPRMDQVEGYNAQDESRSLFLRREVEVTLEDGSKTEAFVYIYARDIPETAEKIEDGVWPI